MTKKGIPKTKKKKNLKKKKVYAYFFDGYWEDIGNIASFFEAHMELTKSVPRFNFYDEEYRFFTRTICQKNSRRPA